MLIVNLLEVAYLFSILFIYLVYDGYIGLSFSLSLLPGIVHAAMCFCIMFWLLWRACEDTCIKNMY